MSAAGEKPDRAWVAPALPVVVALVLALVFHGVVRTPTPLRGTDAWLYNALASTVAGFGGDVHLTIENMAVHGWTLTLLMGAVYRAAGAPSPAAFGFLQAAVFLPATTALVFVAGRHAFGRTVGLVAAWAFALWFPLLYYTIWPLPETTVGLVSAGVLALTALLIVGGGMWVAVSLGLALALLDLTHPAWQFLPLVVVVALFAHFYRYERERLRMALLVALTTAAVLAPYMFLQAQAGLPRPGTGGKGIALGAGWSTWVGSREWTDFGPTSSDYTIGNVNQNGGVKALARLIRSGHLDTDPYMRDLILERADRSGSRTGELTEADYYRAAIHNLVAHPEAWPHKVAHGLTTVFLPARGLALYDPPPVKQAWIRQPWRVVGAVLVLAMILGLVLVALRRRDRLVLFVPLIFETAVFIVGAPESRYGYPLMSSVLLLAAYAFVQAGDVVRVRLEQRYVAAAD